MGLPAMGLLAMWPNWLLPTKPSRLPKGSEVGAAAGLVLARREPF
jgi:hypothetical protein